MGPEIELHARSQRAAQREADATQANIRRRHHPKKEINSTVISQHQKTRKVMMYQARTQILKNWILVLDVVLETNKIGSLYWMPYWILILDVVWGTNKFGSWYLMSFGTALGGARAGFPIYSYIQMTRLFMLSRPITVNGIKTAPLLYIINKA